jgi:thymidylate synthase
VQNLHIYDRHFDAVSEILNRNPLDAQPKIVLKENKNFYDYNIEDFDVLYVEDIPKIKSKLELAV